MICIWKKTYSHTQWEFKELFLDLLVSPVIARTQEQKKKKKKDNYENAVFWHQCSNVSSTKKFSSKKCFEMISRTLSN